MPAGWNSPWTTRPAAASRCSAPSVTATPRPKRAAAAVEVNGPWVRAYRARRSPSGSLTGSVKASGTPTGSAVPRASRSRPASSIAAQWSVPAIRTRMARRAAASSCAHCGSAPRSASSASVSGPSSRSRSATPSASLTRRSSVSHWSSCSSSVRTSASSSSRSSAWPSSSASSRESSDRAAARRSASGRVALVEELCDVSEEERAGEGRRLRRGDLDQADLAGLDVAHQLGEARNVEDVLEAFADRLQDDRERAELAGHLEQLGGTLALLPQRGALAGAAARQQQRAGGALAEPGREQRRAADLVGDDLVDLALVEGDVRGADGRLLGARCVQRGADLRGLLVEQVQAHQVGVRQPQHNAVVGVHDLGVHAVPLGEPGAQREGPRGVDLGAEGGVHDDPPVAELVPEALHDDRAVVGDVSAGLALFGQVRQDVVGGPGVESGCQQPQPGVVLRECADLAKERPQRAAQFQRAAQLVALPEGQTARDSGGGGDQDPVARDVLDAPGAGAEGEHVPDPGFVHHLLVELADPAAALLGVRAGEEDPEEPAVRDRAPGGDGQALRSRAAGDRAGDAVPHHARAQLREGVGRIAAREHVEHGGEGRLRERGEGSGAADRGQQVVDLPGVEGHHGDELLREHVEGIGRHLQGLDGAGAHPLRDHGGLDEVTAVLGEDHAGGDRAHLVAGAADALEAGGHRRRRLDLDDEVHRAHVDAQLQAGGGDHRGQTARLEIFLDERALFFGDRAVVGAGDHRGAPWAAPEPPISSAGAWCSSKDSPVARS